MGPCSAVTANGAPALSSLRCPVAHLRNAGEVSGYRSGEGEQGPQLLDDPLALVVADPPVEDAEKRERVDVLDEKTLPRLVLILERCDREPVLS